MMHPLICQSASRHQHCNVDLRNLFWTMNELCQNESFFCTHIFAFIVWKQYRDRESLILHPNNSLSIKIYILIIIQQKVSVLAASQTASVCNTFILSDSLSEYLVSSLPRYPEPVSQQPSIPSYLSNWNLLGLLQQLLRSEGTNL